MKKFDLVSLITRCSIFLISAILIFIFKDKVQQNLYIILFCCIFALNMDEIIFAIIHHRFTHNFLIGKCVISIILSFVILFTTKDHFDFTCYYWAIYAILDISFESGEYIPMLFEKKFYILIKIAFMAFEFYASVELVRNPHHHAELHIILLGIEFIDYSIKIAIEEIERVKHNHIGQPDYYETD
jgi:hypothetical protein